MLKSIKILAGLLVTVVLAVLALPFVVDVNDYKDDISKAVYAATGRHLSIDHIELSVFPWVGVRLNQVQLQNAAGFAAEHMLSVDVVDVQLELIPLFSQRIEVKRFELDTPQIWLAQHADGENNWSDLMQHQRVAEDSSKPSSNATPASPSDLSKTDASTPATAAAPISFNAELLRLKHGQVTWSDDVYGNVSLSDIQLDIHHLQLLQPMAIDFSAKVAGSPVSLHADVGPVGDLASLDIQKLPILLRLQSESLAAKPFAAWLPVLKAEQVKQMGALADLRLAMDISVEQHADGQLLSSGDVTIHAKHELSLSWKLNSDALKSIHLQSFKLGVDQSHVLRLSGEVKHLKSRPRFEMRLETAKLQRIWLNQYVPALQQLYAAHSKPWKTVKLSALVAGDAELLDIRNLQLLLNDEAVQISGNVALGSAPDVQLRIAAADLHLDPWLPKPVASKEAAQASPEAGLGDGYAQVEVAVEPDLRFLKPWYVSLQVNVQAVHVMKLKLEALKVTMSAEKGVIRLNPLRFDLGDGSISENFTLNAKVYPATWQESLRMQGVQVLPLLQAVADLDVLSGVATLRTDMRGKGLLPAKMMQSLKGNGKFTFTDGQVKGVNIAKEIRKLQKKSDLGNSNSTDFAQMLGSFRIHKGVLSNKDLYMASPLFRLSGKGKLYFEPLSVDYHVRPKLIDSLAGQGGGRSQKGLVVPLHISGAFDDLNISLEMDRDALLESAAALNKLSGNKIGGVAGKVLDQGFVKTRDEEVKKAKQKLQQQLAAEKARLQKAAEDKLKQQAEEKLRNALKGFGF